MMKINKALHCGQLLLQKDTEYPPIHSLIWIRQQGPQKLKYNTKQGRQIGLSRLD